MDPQFAIDSLRSNPKGVRFSELVRICTFFFGEPRHQRTSHVVYRMPWRGDPRINLQSKRGMAKPYQVRQVINALERLQDVED